MYKSHKNLFETCCKMLVTAGMLWAGGSTSAQQITRMRCEYGLRPLCIDAASPRLTWNIQSAKPLQQSKYRVVVGTDSLQLASGNGASVVWDSGVITSDISRAVCRDAGLQSFKRYFWRVTVWDGRGRKIESSIEPFETALMNQADWHAVWITDSRHRDFEPAPMFRKVFNIDGHRIKRARFYYSAAAYGAFKLNGRAVSADLLNPGYTHYDRRNLYSVYDVTPMLHGGTNVITAVLGNGFYNAIGKVATWSFDTARWRNRARMTCLLRVEFDNGKVQEICSDDTWKTSTGPYLVNNIYAGDKYDSRLEKTGWEQPSYDDSSWQRAMVVAAPSPLMTAQKMPAIQISRRFKATSMQSWGDTVFVYSFPQNISGFCKLKVQGPSGTKLTLQHGEMKRSDGRLEMRNIACYYSPMPDKEFQTDTYILNGSRQELEPMFCYHGFQYVEVHSSRPIHLTKESLTAEFFHTNVQRTGHFECSNELLNKISDATIASYLSNLMSIPTDCPQREKNGWTADAHMSMDVALMNFDGVQFYEKWLDDISDNQNDSGRISGIVPSPDWGYDDWIGPVWASVMFGVPQKLYDYYGDTRPIEKMWPVCEKYLNYLKRRENADKTVTYGIGDWVAYKTITPTDYTTTCFYYFDNKTMARFARILGKDATPYEQKAEYLQKLIMQKYFDPARGVFSNGSQAAQGVALYLGIVPDEQAQRVADNLSRMIAENGDALDCGMLGSKTILRVLCDYGHADQAYRLASRSESPSWGSWIKRGLTTLPETWVLSPAFRDASLNHIFLGDVQAWMYQYLAGIMYDTQCPGFKHVLLQPRFVKELDDAKAEYNSPAGLIKSAWKRKGNSIILDVELPANISATLITGSKKQELTGGRHRIKLAAGK